MHLQIKCVIVDSGFNNISVIIKIIVVCPSISMEGHRKRFDLRLNDAILFLAGYLALEARTVGGLCEQWQCYSVE